MGLAPAASTRRIPIATGAPASNTLALLTMIGRGEAAGGRPDGGGVGNEPVHDGTGRHLRMRGGGGERGCG